MTRSATCPGVSGMEVAVVREEPEGDALGEIRVAEEVGAAGVGGKFLDGWDNMNLDSATS